MRERLKDNYRQEWCAAVRDNDRYSLYHSFKSVFEPELYLTDLMFKPYRDILIKIRLQVSQLLCHKNKFLQINDHLCPLCFEESENELHFILKCNRLEDIRCTILPAIAINNRSLESLRTLFAKEEYSFCLGKYLFFAMKYRMNALENVYN